MNLDEALVAFLSESRELLERMEQALLRIEQAPDDVETLNEIFRAAHTIKGSAGIFGLDHIVAFAHVAENVLDEARSGHIRFDGRLASLFLAVSDHVRALVDHLERGTAVDDALEGRGAGLVARMQQVLAALDERLLPDLSAERSLAQADIDPVRCAAPDAATTDNWHISLRLGRDTIRNGFDPLSFIRYLGTLGTLAHVETLLGDVPALSELEPDDCHFGFEIALRSDADKLAIEGAFEFVREDSVVRILPPHSRVAAYRALISELPLDDLRLGEILVRCGTLTRAELDGALDEQTVASHQGTPVAPLGELLIDHQQIHPEVLDAALARQTQVRETQVRETRQPEAQMLRVDAAKLDHLIDLVGELIIAGAGAALRARKLRLKDMIQATSSVTRLMEEVRDSALKLRMVQIGGTFNRFQRVVRDVSQELDKDIVLQIDGAETELDKAVVEQLADPLTHLVRNAMDHGIESAERRAQAGKPVRGTVRLHARHDAGQVVIEVSDDGGGLSKERILAKAVERGLVAAGSVLSDKEIFDLIFEPGFSTAAQVSNLSGRGVGMDVVKRGISELRGSITLRSTPDAGTTVSIRLPLTLAIIDGFLVAVGKASYVVPLSSVSECIELDRGEALDRDWLDLRGEVLPLVRLRELYAIDGEIGRRQNVVVVQTAGLRIGLVVDQLLGELQTVIKPLGRVFRRVRGVSGFTILGSGAVALLLDIPDLVSQAGARARLASEPPGRESPLESAASPA